jgi:hypothetical protein
MKTVVFEVGLLGFFVSAVVFGAQGASLFDMVARAFIVFIGIELAATLVLAMLMARPPEVSSDVPSDGDATDTSKRRGPAIQAKA